MARGPPPRHRLPHPELFGPHELGDDAARSEGPSLPAPAHSAACNAAARTVTTQPCRVRRANKLLSKEREHSRTNLTQAQGPRRGEHWACRARRAGFPRARPHRPPPPTRPGWQRVDVGAGRWAGGWGLRAEEVGGSAWSEPTGPTPSPPPPPQAPRTRSEHLRTGGVPGRLKCDLFLARCPCLHVTT